MVTRFPPLCTGETPVAPGDTLVAPGAVGSGLLPPRGRYNYTMQFSLRTLLILMAVLPPLIAFPLFGLALAIVAALPGFLLFLVYLPALLDP